MPAGPAPRCVLGDGDATGGPARHQRAAVGGKRRLGGGERSPRPPAAGARLGVDERLGQIGLAHAVGHSVECGGGAAEDHDADAEALAHVARDQLHFRRVLLVADEARQRPRAALVKYEPQCVAAHEEQLMVELRIPVEVAHGRSIRDS